MARISKDEHPRILRMVDEQHCKVAEVAAEYGCTPANIYALLSKLRREVPSGPEAVNVHEDPPVVTSPPVLEQPLPPHAVVPAAAKDVPDLFSRSPQDVDPATFRAKVGRRRSPPTGTNEVADLEISSEEARPNTAGVPKQEPETVASLPSRSTVIPLAAPEPVKKGSGLGAALAKPGVALMMRTADGEENLTPFRSLDDLLSAIKPILRAAARSPDAVWFSIQPVDLASLDSDAA